MFSQSSLHEGLVHYFQDLSNLFGGLLPIIIIELQRVFSGGAAMHVYRLQASHPSLLYIWGQLILLRVIYH